MSGTKEKRGDRVMTPDWCALDIVAHFNPSGRVLEPFKGGGAFLRAIPTADWCEIDEGRDFFRWREPVDWIVSNPPYSLTRPVFKHARSVSVNVVLLVPLRNIFSGYGFVRELMTGGGLAGIRLYGTGNRLGFPMGNCVGAVHWQRGYQGDTRWTDFNEDVDDLVTRAEDCP